MYNIHPSLLSSYHLYLTQDWMTIERIIEDIKTSNNRGEAISNEAMDRGTAFHKILENPNEHYHGLFYRADDIRFSDSIKEYIDKIDPKSLKEISSGKILFTSHGKVVLDGTVDNMIGITINDYKTTKQFKLSYYSDSPQWKCYLLIFNAVKFIYKVFVLKDDKKSGSIYVKDYHEIPVYAYPHMEEDMTCLCEDLIQFSKGQNIEKYLMQ